MFYDYINDFVVVYMDDVVVFSESLVDHIGHLKLVLSRLWEHQLYLKLESANSQETIKFLGHDISEDEV